MAGILPEGTAGGLVIRDAGGNPTNPPGVQNAYVPAPGFVSDCELTALPSDCTARIEPKQINAIVSELLAFAECMDPDGPWECASVTNLCKSFTSWIAAFEALNDDRYVNIDGDTMTGPLLLPPAAPTDPAEATNKQYVDDAIAIAIAAAEGLDETKFVNVAGDTMTGNLRISKINPTLVLEKQTVAENIAIYGQMAGTVRWTVVPGDNIPEAGANAGSNFSLNAFNDAGAFLYPTLTFLRSTGLGTVHGDPTDPLGIATKQYVDTSVASVAGSVVRTDVVQAFTEAQKAQGRANIDAAPFDAIGYFGMQVNGSAQIAQTGAGVEGSVISGLNYFSDIWQAGAASAGATFAAGNLGGYLANVPWAFDRYVRLRATTKITAVAAGDYALMGIPIEGYRVVRPGLGRGGTAYAQPVTIAFWALADVSGTASVVMRNAPTVTRSCILNFTLVAGVAKYVVLTFPPCNDGAWLTDNGVGMRLDFVFACGTTYQTATPGVWVAGNILGTAANTNFFPANNNTVSITGLIVLPGSQAPTAAQSPNALRQMSDELLLCKRYLNIIPVTTFFGPGHLRAGGTSAYISMQMPVPMRINPAMPLPGDTKLWSADSSSALTSLTINLPTLMTDGFMAATCSVSVGVPGAACFLYSPTSPFPFDARM